MFPADVLCAAAVATLRSGSERCSSSVRCTTLIINTLHIKIARFKTFYYSVKNNRSPPGLSNLNSQKS